MTSVPRNMFTEVRQQVRQRQADRFCDGVAFAFDPALEQPAIWGKGEEILFSPGEPVLIAAPDGTGKTTLGQRLALARVGVGDELLGFPVRQAEGNVVYISADRPKQGARSLRRMILGLPDPELIKVRDGLTVWKGPLPFDLVREPHRLMEFVAERGGSDVFMDSLGVIVPGLAKDEVGSAIAQAWSYCSASDIEVVALHHNRKPTSENRKPNKLEDVYGSRWITTSAGSIISLWGQAGDPVVELSHLKQPNEPVGPFMVDIDHRAGTVGVGEGTDLLDILRAKANGLSAGEGAVYMEGATDRAREGKAYRKLEGYVARGLAYRREGALIRGSVHEPDRYFATSTVHVHGGPE